MRQSLSSSLASQNINVFEFGIKTISENCFRFQSCFEAMAVRRTNCLLYSALILVLGYMQYYYSQQIRQDSKLLLSSNPEKVLFLSTSPPRGMGLFERQEGLQKQPKLHRRLLGRKLMQEVENATEVKCNLVCSSHTVMRAGWRILSSRRAENKLGPETAPEYEKARDESGKGAVTKAETIRDTDRSLSSSALALPQQNGRGLFSTEKNNRDDSSEVQRTTLNSEKTEPNNPDSIQKQSTALVSDRLVPTGPDPLHHTTSPQTKVKVKHD
ncbi:hypothetical protein O6H91_08G039400 [Diphasiastrum complanatum]|uniref:Uncharacterized protein n=1 Tax=Diphasiastrum complanatum TaxID=34168 RepID=A0ACC2CX06_DIPCM|nr:hypothetical protein O6H91_08G039400 [Diphasiastrum complanatum]